MNKENLKVPFKAYKVFNRNWECMPNPYKSYMKYEVGKEYKFEGKIKICKSGFHACLKLVDCFNYYQFDINNKVAEVEILGDFELQSEDSKICTNHIKIVKELSWFEVLELCNTGKENSGYGNSGNWNSGNWNSGNKNIGNMNSGHNNSGYGNSGNLNLGNWNSSDCNLGNRNSGHSNLGHFNSGDRNSGSQNTGSCNLGNRNSGDGNLSNNNSGCFNTQNHTIYFFDKHSDLTYEDWKNHPAYIIWSRLSLTTFVPEKKMTDEEKRFHKNYKTIGGFLKVYDFKKAAKIWWDNLSKNEKDIIKSIPNFDSDKFYMITGIRV